MPVWVQDHVAFKRLVTALARCASDVEFMAIMGNEMQAVLPHGAMICGFWAMSQRVKRPAKIVMSNMPRAYLDSVRAQDSMLRNPVVLSWLYERRPLFFAAQPTDQRAPKAWLQAFRLHKMQNVAVHGQFDLGGKFVSFFSFYRIPIQMVPLIDEVLGLLVPHLHAALAQLPYKAQIDDPEDPIPPDWLGKLTGREREVLRWLCEGKSNWEIGKLLGTTENTIKKQVRQVFAKLGVSNRAHAVAKIGGHRT